MFTRIIGLAFFLCCVSTASATVITSVTAGANTSTQTFGAATFFNSPGNAGNGAIVGTSPNTITLNAAVESGYVNNTPFSWTIGFVDNDGGSSDGNTKYAVTVNLTNNRFHPIAPVIFRLSDPTLSAILDGSTIVGQNSFVSLTSPAPTSTYNGATFNGLMGGVQTLYFGGLNGGGGQLNTGETATFTFTLDLADYQGLTGNGLAAGTFVLSMVATPEPASLALAGFAMSAAGAGVIQRRRKRRANASPQSVDAAS